PCFAYLCRQRRPGLLRRRSSRPLSPSSILRRSCVEGRQTSRFAGPAANQVRVDHQPQDRQGIGSHRAGDAARPRRRGDRMKRRAFITLLGGAAAWPLAARAQQSAMPVVGFVYPGVPELSAGVVAAFRKGLNETGFIEGRNVTVEFRFAYNDNARLPELVGDLVRRGVAVIATPASPPATLAGKTVTTTVPIVFGIGADPVEIGLVASLNRPGGNATGITSMNAELGTKRLGLLHELLPRAVRFAVLLNPNNRNTDALTRDLQATASAIGKQVDVLTAKSTREIDAAFVTLSQRPADALVITPDQLLDNRGVQLVTL